MIKDHTGSLGQQRKKENMRMANKSINIGDFEITEDGKPYLIAEIGINHNGDLQIAKKLIDAANATGWHAVKFQKCEPDISVPEAQKSVMRDTPWGRITYLDYKKHIEFGKKEYDYIDAYCREKPICWSASPWDIPSLEFLLEYNVPFIKIASASITDDELVSRAALSGKTIIMSTGMSTLEEIDRAVSILDKKSNGNYILMHTCAWRVCYYDIWTTMLFYKLLVQDILHITSIEQGVVYAVKIRVYLSIFNSLWHIFYANDLFGIPCNKVSDSTCTCI